MENVVCERAEGVNCYVCQPTNTCEVVKMCKKETNDFHKQSSTQKPDTIKFKGKRPVR